MPGNDMTEERQIEKIARLEATVSSLQDAVKAGFIEVKSDLKEIKDGLVSRVEKLEMTKLSASDFITFRSDYVESSKDTNIRLEKLERFFWGASAIIGVIQFLGLGVLVYILRAILK